MTGPASGREIEPVGRASLPAHLEPVFSTYRRCLPHWRLAGSIYFVTWRLAKSQSRLSPAERDLIVQAVRHFDGDRYDLFAWVVMDDHAHVLLKPTAEQPLEEILHSWKSFTARQLQKEYLRVGKVWQDESFDRIVRNEAEFLQKAEYIARNPSKRWPDLTHYDWMGVRSPEGDGRAGTPAPL